MNRYSDEELIQILRDKAKELGRIPRKRDVTQYQIIAARFGWKNALKMAGLLNNINREKRTHAEEKIEQTIEALKKYSKEHGFPTINEWTRFSKQNNLYSVGKLKSHFRMSWEDIGKYLGYSVKERNISKEECIKAFHLAAQELGKAFSKRQYEVWSKKNGMPGLNVILRRFNMTFNELKAELGLIPNEKPSHALEYTEEELKRALQDCYQHYERIFTEAEYEEWRKKQDIPRPSIETIRFHFGSVPRSKEELDIPTYQRHMMYRSDDYRSYIFRFVRDQLTLEKYEKWAKENDAMSIVAISRLASSFEDALVEVLEEYIKYLKSAP